MALGSGSSLATDCSTRRRGAPASFQLLRAGRASRLHQVSSKKPTAHSACRSATRISRSRRLFSLVLRIWGSDPPLRPLPAHPQPHQSGADSLARDLPFGYSLLEAHLGGHLQGPQAAVFAEAPRVLMKHLPESLGALGVEGRVDGMRPGRASAQRRLKTTLVEDMDGVA